MNKNQLLSSMPDYYVDSELVDNILNAYAKQFNKLQEKYNKANNQLSYHTADMELYRWEQDYGIVTNINKSLEERRALISAKFKNRGTVTVSFLKSLIKIFVNEVDIVEHNSESYFDVTLKTKTSLGNKIDDIISQIESSKPCHLAYELILDYFTVLIMHINFARYRSRELIHCGKIDISGNPRVATDGISYLDNFVDSINKYFSNNLAIASEKLFTKGTLGKRYIENIKDTKKAYSSNIFEQASDKTVSNFIIGRSEKENLIDKTYSYRSTQLKTVSENNFIHMIDGLSECEEIKEQYLRYLSECFKVTEGTDGIHENEYATDKYSVYLSVDILKCSAKTYCKKEVDKSDNNRWN